MRPALTRSRLRLWRPLTGGGTATATAQAVRACRWRAFGAACCDHVEEAFQPLPVATSKSLGAQARTTKRALASAVETKISVADIVWKLNEGNKRFVAQRAAGTRGEDRLSQVNLVDKLIEAPLLHANVRAVVIGDARCPVPIASMFDTRAGELQVMRVCGGIISPKDSLVGSAEFLCEDCSPPLLLVLGLSQNDVMECAVKLAMVQAGRQDAPTLGATEELSLVQQVLPAAQDALVEQPGASFKRLCELASQLSIWRSIEALLKSSKLIADLVASGQIELQGAFFRQETGRVQFLGQHPSQATLLSVRPEQEEIRTAEDPPVAAEEALAMLYVGNRRYAVGMGGQVKLHEKNSRYQLSEGGQNPIAVVVGCADSRAPIEILFDMRPGDLFVLRNAGNICSAYGCSLIGSAEYAITHLRSKLVVVTGHTQCGAVTAAVELARLHQTANLETNIGKVLGEVMPSASKAVKLLPDASISEQVKLATKLNVFDTMQKMIASSDVIHEGVQEMSLRVDGAVYDLFTGTIEWLGQHPDLEKIVGHPMPLHKWKVSPYVVAQGRKACRGVATEALDCLREGNARFVRGAMLRRPAQELGGEPFAILLGGGEVRMPIEKIFDMAEGTVVAQRTLGGLQNSHGEVDTATASVEYAVVRYQPKLIVVLGESESKIVDTALKQIAGFAAPSEPMQKVLADVMVSAQRAVNQVATEHIATSAGRDRRIRQLTVELNTLYTIEQLLFSRIIRDAVRDGVLEIHAAILNHQTGVVDFVGEHPMLEEMIRHHDSQEKMEASWRDAVNSWSDPL